MSSKTYTIRILPLFVEDLKQCLTYLAVNLANKPAAENLAFHAERAVDRITENPEGYPIYYGRVKTDYPYHRIIIQNYSIYYVVIGNVVEIRRILHNRRDIDSLLQ